MDEEMKIIYVYLGHACAHLFKIWMIVLWGVKKNPLEMLTRGEFLVARFVRETKIEIWKTMAVYVLL